MMKSMGISFRHSAGFGKRMEYNLVGKMLMEGLDVYLERSRTQIRAYEPNLCLKTAGEIGS